MLAVHPPGPLAVTPDGQPGSVLVARSVPVEGAVPAGLLGHADHYLEKPLRVDQLIETATALIGRGRRSYPDTPGHDTLPT